MKEEKREVGDWREITIQEFQETMRRIYYERDAQRGAEGTFKWLEEEVSELREELKGDDRKALEDELADVLAWLASLANVLQTNLAEAALRKYDNRCPRCRSSPCKCPPRKAKG